MNGLDWTEFNSTEAIEESLGAFINKEYNNSKHSGINQTPKARYLTNQERHKYKPIEVLNDDFLHRETRKVIIDATIKIQTITFEVPQLYIGQKIEV